MLRPRYVRDETTRRSRGEASSIAIMLARRYVSRPVPLFIAVPVAAVAGMAVSGALAVVVAVLFGALGDQLAPDVYPGGSGARKRARRRRQCSRVPALLAPV